MRAQIPEMSGSRCVEGLEFIPIDRAEKVKHLSVKLKICNTDYTCYDGDIILISPVYSARIVGPSPGDMSHILTAIP